MDKIWEMQDYSEAVAKEIHRHLGVSMVVSRLLAQRGMDGADEAQNFLDAGLDQLTDPMEMQGMAAAVDRIRRAIESQEKVFIYGDYDVDGVCSIVLLKDCLNRLGCQADYYVPDRFSEGYGLNKKAIEILARDGCQLLITVDCGINAVEETKWAMSLGMDMIITDHHTPQPEQPSAWAVINPKNDDIKAIANLAGVGVAFKLACALGTGRIAEEEIYEWLDLVALATVADIVPLLDENRILVKYGLKALGKTKRPGLRALIREAGLEGKLIQSWQVGFVLGPRLNSAGRLGSARTSIELLDTHDEKEACAKAILLCNMNNERRLIEEGIFQEAVAQVDRDIKLEEDPILVVGGEGWHQGVIGIVASRLADLYNRPAIVISWEGNTGRGSARSVSGFDLYGALKYASASLLQFGGHKMAAGLSIGLDQLNDLKEALRQYVGESLIELKRPKSYRVDMDIDEEDIREQLMEEIELLRPFGEGNPAPRFVLRASAISTPVWVGNNRAHLKFRTGLNNIEAIAFNRSDMIDYPLQKSSQDLLFELDVNEFRGKRSLQLKIKDLKSSITWDTLSGEDSDSNRLLRAFRRTVDELREKRPVLFVYPAYRSLVKHQAVLEYYFDKQNLQLLHGHLSREERVWGQNQLTEGASKVFLTTRSFLQYYESSFGLPTGLRYMVRLWPLATPDQDTSNCWQREIETIEQRDKFTLYRSSNRPVNSGRALVYANLGRTVNSLRDEYPELKVEAGLTDMRQRRAVRREFMGVHSGILVSDGTHTSGWPNVGSINEVTLADSPLGRYELAPLIDNLRVDNEIKVGVAFDRNSVERNHIFLNSLYPEIDAVQAVLRFYVQNRRRLNSVNIDSLASQISAELHQEYSRMELQSIMRILADLGLCRVEKSGSIMGINSMDVDNAISSICNSPYYLEGLAEKQVLAEWEKDLNKYLVW
ncbi:MAG: single-stranded-DNA-specific exonuclease RecJ [Firmicutes bacterium HGW-Firmicutes-15]|nr:MAG: single-stranded-DNA-specific exonuclease RecJ [Firmicutes bacterium HGW-Firmicutes-15]